jgi:hypothetical protein
VAVLVLQGVGGVVIKVLGKIEPRVRNEIIPDVRLPSHIVAHGSRVEFIGSQEKEERDEKDFDFH